LIEPIRASDVFAELERLSVSNQDGGPEGFTGDELAAHLGVGHRAAMYRVKQWHRDGLIEYAGRRKVVNNVGSVSCIPVYRMKEKAK
jgi:hypothetical protein